MDVREKLVELCEDLETLPCCDTYEGQADYLIAHGVTGREKGEWIWGQSKSNGNFWYMCSNCGFAPDEEQPYCPYCGADMIPDASKDGDSE